MTTIIDAWREMTTCKDCCSGQPEMDSIRCLVRNDWNTPKWRCDSGLWLFRGKSPGVIGGPYEIPFDIKDWLELQVGINPDSYTLIPREEWPECDHA